MARAGGPHGLSHILTSTVCDHGKGWGPHGLSHNLTSTVSDHGKGWGPHGLSHTPHNGVCVVRQEVRISVPSKSIIAMSNTSVHKRDCIMRKI